MFLLVGGSLVKLKQTGAVTIADQDPWELVLIFCKMCFRALLTTSGLMYHFSRNAGSMVILWLDLAIPQCKYICLSDSILIGIWQWGHVRTQTQLLRQRSA